VEKRLSLDLGQRNAGHILRAIHDLASASWRPLQFPSGAKIAKNQQLVELRTPRRSIRIRLSVYKVGGRGESHRLHQQRIEITTTYNSGLGRLRDWADVVLGYDSNHDAYVGLDPRRLALGGTTHNASTSIDPAVLVASSNARVLVRPHESRSFGLEYQAFFRPRRLGEYLFNYGRIHEGIYRGDGVLSGSMRNASRYNEWTLPVSSCRGRWLVLTQSASAVARRTGVARRVIEAYENRELARFADMSPEELERIKRRCQEVGDSGEAFVYKCEIRRLHNAGRRDLAEKVDWVSRRAVGRGYDIKSFAADGTPKFIEVKATIGKGASFFCSSNEWAVAMHRRRSYWIYRVVQALDGPRISAVLRDPVGAERAKSILRVADGWRITILE